MGDGRWVMAMGVRMRRGHHAMAPVRGPRILPASTVQCQRPPTRTAHLSRGALQLVEICISYLDGRVWRQAGNGRL